MIKKFREYIKEKLENVMSEELVEDEFLRLKEVFNCRITIRNFIFYNKIGVSVIVPVDVKKILMTKKNSTVKYSTIEWNQEDENFKKSLMGIEKEVNLIKLRLESEKIHIDIVSRKFILIGENIYVTDYVVNIQEKGKNLGF